MGELLGVCMDTAAMYLECQARHRALAESVKPGFSFWGLFR